MRHLDVMHKNTDMIQEYFRQNQCFIGNRIEFIRYLYYHIKGKNSAFYTDQYEAI